MARLFGLAKSVAVIFLVVMIFMMPTAAEMMSVEPIRAEFTPGNYSEFVPIDDGTKLIVHNPLIDLYFWKAKVMLFLNRLFYDTPYHEFVQLEITPFLSKILGSVPFLIFFVRKKPDYTKPNSTAGKILSFLEENPISSEPTIIRGVGKSRGAVSYQLHVLLFDNQIYAAEISGKTYYSGSPISPDAKETALSVLKNNATQSSIFSYICKHPGVTRKEIADALSLTPESVRYQLKNIDPRLIKKENVEGRETYTAEKWARKVW